MYYRILHTLIYLVCSTKGNYIVNIFISNFSLASKKIFEEEFWGLKHEG